MIARQISQVEPVGRSRVDAFASVARKAFTVTATVVALLASNPAITYASSVKNRTCSAGVNAIEKTIQNASGYSLNRFEPAKRVIISGNLITIKSVNQKADGITISGTQKVVIENPNHYSADVTVTTKPLSFSLIPWKGSGYYNVKVEGNASIKGSTCAINESVGRIPFINAYIANFSALIVYSAGAAGTAVISIAGISALTGAAVRLGSNLRRKTAEQHQE